MSTFKQERFGPIPPDTLIKTREMLEKLLDIVEISPVTKRRYQGATEWSAGRLSAAQAIRDFGALYGYLGPTDAETFINQEIGR